MRFLLVERFLLVYEAICAIAPELAPVFCVFYAIWVLFPAVGIWAQVRQCVGRRERGVRQGDLLAMLFFSIGQQETLVKLHEMVQEVKMQVGSTLPAGVVGYADDTTVYIGERGARLVVQRAVEIIDATRMKVKVSNSGRKVLVYEGRRDKVQPPDGEGMMLFDIVDSGVVVLGNPVGSVVYRRGELARAVGKMGKALPALTRVDP